MSKSSKSSKGRRLAKPTRLQTPAKDDFDVVVRLIESARIRAVAAVNTTLIELYWSIGEHLSQKISRDGWGKSTVEALAATIQRRFPGMTGFRQ